MGVAIINVVDEQAHASREFRCDIKMLLAHMKLLAADMEDVPGHDVEITVKCDISTFAWLIAYVKAESRGQQPETTLSNCVQLLLASHYLQMSPVLRSSVAFIASNLLALVPTAAAQLCSLEGSLLDKLAKAVQEEVLEALHQQQQQQQQQHQQQASAAHSALPAQPNRSSSCSGSTSSACVLVDKLYKHKLRALLQQQDSTVLRCEACWQLFATASHHKLQCPAGQLPTNRQYKLPLHDPDPTWDLQTFLAQQRTAANSKAPKANTCRQQQPQDTCMQQQQQHAQEHGQQGLQVQEQQQQGAMSWRELYWFVWGYVVVLYCQRCCSHFPARLLQDCSYHPLPAVFTSDEAIGQYACCGAPAWQPGGSAVVAAAAASLQPCCKRDHDAYVPADGNSSSSSIIGNCKDKASHQQEGSGSQKAAKGGKRARIDARRALQLLRQFGPVITNSPVIPATMQRQQQQQQPQQQLGQQEGKMDAAGMASSAAMQQQQQPKQQQRGPALPLLVKMVNRGASSAAASAGAGAAAGDVVSCRGAGRKAPGSRPSSVSPLPLISPRQWSAHSENRSQNESASKQQRVGEQQEYSLPAAAAAAMAAAAARDRGRSSAGLHGERPRSSNQIADADNSISSSSSSSSGSGSCSDSGSGESSRNSSRSSSASYSSRSSAMQDEAPKQGKHNHAAIADTADGGADVSDNDEFCLSGAHATPLGSMMGAVRAAADARTKGVGLSVDSGAGRLSQIGAPLAETFSAGGRRVLTNMGRKPQRPTSQLENSNSRPSTAASLLSLKQQPLGGQSPSRPRTGGSSVGRMAGAAAAAAAAAGRSDDGGVRSESGMGGVSTVGAAFNRTLLLEMVQQDDAYRMGVLMRKLDSLRLQPPPDCGEKQQHGLLGRPQQLTQVDVMTAINGVMFESKYN